VPNIKKRLNHLVNMWFFVVYKFFLSPPCDILFLICDIYMALNRKYSFIDTFVSYDPSDDQRSISEQRWGRATVSTNPWVRMSVNINIL
jgi:hypothetical protein